MTYLELSFLASAALKELSTNNLISFFEVANYYIQVRLCLIDKETDQFYPLMKELGLYSCLKAMLMLLHLFMTQSIQMPPQNISSLLGCLLDYLKLTHIYRGVVHYMNFIQHSLVRLSQVLPQRYASMRDEMLSLQSLISIWLQENYMPNRVSLNQPFRGPYIRNLLLPLEQNRSSLSADLTPEQTTVVNSHIGVLAKPLMDHFSEENPVIQTHRMIMEGKNANFSLDDAYNLTDQNFMNSWLQKLANTQTL